MAETETQKAESPTLRQTDTAGVLSSFQAFAKDSSSLHHPCSVDLSQEDEDDI